MEEVGSGIGETVELEKCLVCDGELLTLKKEVVDCEWEEFGGEQVDKEQNKVLEWFLKRFKKKREGSRGFPFCGGCKMELEGLRELERQLEAIQQRIKRGMEEIRRKMNRLKKEDQGKANCKVDKRSRRRRVIVKATEDETKPVEETEQEKLDSLLLMVSWEN